MECLTAMHQHPRLLRLENWHLLPLDLGMSQITFRQEPIMMYS